MGLGMYGSPLSRVVKVVMAALRNRKKTLDDVDQVLQQQRTFPRYSSPYSNEGQACQKSCVLGPSGCHRTLYVNPLVCLSAPPIFAPVPRAVVSQQEAEPQLLKRRGSFQWLNKAILSTVILPRPVATLTCWSTYLCRLLCAGAGGRWS